MKEDQNTEFKRNWRDDFLRELCAFANTQGGTLYIGVDDNGTIIGVPKSKELLENLPNKIQSNLGILSQVNLQTHDDKDTIAISVLPQNRPISYEGKFYIRIGSTTQELRGQDLATFLHTKMNVRWDAITHPEAKLSDLDDEAWRYFIYLATEKSKRLNPSAQTENMETVLRKLQLISESGELTNAALMLFGKDIERWSIMSAYRIGRFGATQADLLTQDSISCPLVMMPEKVMEVLRTKYLVSTFAYESMRRIEKLEIPEEGFREIICNAIMHRDYEATFIQMRIWDQEIELWNPGTLPHNFTIETLMQKHESCPRNPLIAKVFFLAGFIENWGRGYEKIHHEFAKAGLQQPVFEQLRGGMMATIQREVFLKIRGAQSVIAGTEQPTGNDAGNDTGNDRGNDLGKIKLIVCSLNREILRREELMTRMKLRSSSNYRDQYLYPAMAAGYVAMTLPDKPQSKNQKYYLTPKGLALLDEINNSSSK